ncbi:secretin and TonB N-terminal domain-containing protein [Pelagicoccus sp. SDUM812002]|uniref:type II secretion system protein GspD n=1 Tax=Pelagicoccus sp. SDUM812002 TaxID=3041266 RepID=UPI00280E1B00|nr:secretin and TonB N-terminal domain-containing protein [Pelagicoccus sp. SDUM812002]MDQ8186471.1 secretin and TonB N-terminal domain-containing protein [Pelagicoccus sp. SDUM812002]
MSSYLPPTVKAVRFISFAIAAIALASTAIAQSDFVSNSATESSQLNSQDSQQLFSFKAVNVDLQQALATFADANDLNIIPDQDILGSITVSFKNLPLDLAMDALIDAHGYYFTKKGNLIRVRNFQTRIFEIDYINTIRSGAGSNDIQFSSGGGSSEQGTTMRVSADSTIDFWKSITDQLEDIVSEEGTFTVNSLAGLVSITERYSKMSDIAAILERVSESVVRQVELEVEIYEVSISDSEQLGINWGAVSNRLDTNFTGSLVIPRTSIGSSFEGNTFTASWTDSDNSGNTALLEALSQQGNVKVLSKPKLRTINNQPAVIRVGQDIPVFRQTVTQSPGNPPILTTQEEIENITVGTILSITPQISSNGMITLDVSPAVSRLIRNEVSAVTGASAPVIEVRQASSIVRIRDGNTVVLGGLVQTQNTKTLRKIPLAGDIPLLGKLFRGYRDASVNNELVIILTPKIAE